MSCKAHTQLKSRNPRVADGDMVLGHALKRFRVSRDVNIHPD
jgi:hypothetical protein